MVRLIHPKEWILALGCVMGLAASAVAGSTTSADVLKELDHLDRWMAGQKHGAAWRPRLKLDALAAELRAAQPNFENLAEARHRLAQYQPAFHAFAAYGRARLALDRYLTDLATESLAELPQRLRAEKARYLPVTEAAVKAAKDRLWAAYQRLDRVLTGDDEVRRLWRDYLGWEDLRDELTLGEEPDLQFLADVDRQFDDNDRQLNRTEFAAVGRALREYLVKLRQFTNESAQADYEATLDKLADAVEAASKEPTRENRQAMSEALAVLEEQRRVPYLTQAVRAHFARPNLHLAVSDSLLAAAMQRHVDETRPVQEVILGAQVSGTAHTVGEVSVRVVPNDGAAELHAVFDGNSITRTVGRKGPACIYTDGATRIEAFKQILMDSGGLQWMQTVADACRDSKITGVGVTSKAFRKVITKIAWKKALEAKPQADRIAEGRSEYRFRSRFDERVEAELADARDNYEKRFRRTLQRRGQFPDLHFSSTQSQVHVVATHAPPGRLAAASPMPAVSQDGELLIRLHETAVGNLARTLVGGETLTRKRWARIKKDYNIQREDTIEGEWWIALADQPITLQINDQGIRVTVHALGFERDGRSYDTPLDVTATYRVALADGGVLRLTREGDIEVNPPDIGDRRLTTKETAAKPVLERTFARIFTETKDITEVELPGDLKKAGKLHFAGLELSDDGWAVLVLNRLQGAQ